VNRTGEDAAHAHAGADRGKEVALKVEEVDDEVVGLGFDGELAALEIGDAGIDGQACGAIAQNPNGRLGTVNSSDLPAQRGEVEGVASVAAGEIEGAAGCDGFDYLSKERSGREIKIGGVEIVLVPIAGHGCIAPVEMVQSGAAGGLASAANHSCSSVASGLP